MKKNQIRAKRAEQIDQETNDALYIRASLSNVTFTAVSAISSHSFSVWIGRDFKNEEVEVLRERESERERRGRDVVSVL